MYIRSRNIITALAVLLVSVSMQAKKPDTLAIGKPRTLSDIFGERTLNVDRLLVPMDTTGVFGSLSLDEAGAYDEPMTNVELEELLRLSANGEPFDTTKVPSAAIYNTWSNTHINPYKFQLLKWKDTMNLDLSGYTHPFLNRITSEFGMRRGRYHYGIDVKVITGDSVRAAFDGVVRMARYNRGGYGYYVVIRHYNGLETVYGHFSKNLVKPNQPVRSGQVIGLGGNTGRSTGSHLHFEVRYQGFAFNPRDIIDFETGLIRENHYQLALDKNYSHEVEMSKTRWYTVRKGDTLSRIASRNGTTVSKLCRLNGIKSTSILRIGQRLKISGPTS